MKKEIIDLTDAVMNQSDFITTCSNPVKELTIEDVRKMEVALAYSKMMKAIFNTPLSVNHRTSYGIQVQPKRIYGVSHFS